MLQPAMATHGDAVGPYEREAWAAKQVAHGANVLICRPRLVQTGLDLIEFPTIVWFETDYSLYTMRQASRRSRRIGQTEPVRVVFMAYRNTLQADALELVAQKLQSSLAVEGELPKHGLAAYGDDGDNLMLALARKLVSGEEDADSVESVFAQAQQVAADAEALLVDGGWNAVKLEPVSVGVGTNGANGHSGNGFRRSAGLVPCGHHRAAVGSLDQASEPHQTLFSWAEFMAAQADKPEAREPRPATASFFESALAHERDAELVDVGRCPLGATTAATRCGTARSSWAR